MATRTALVIGADGRPQQLQAGDAIPGPAHRTFGAAGTPTLNATTPPVYLNRAYTCNGVEAGCDTTPSGSPATVTLQTSTDGVTWTTLVAVSIAAAAYTGTASATSSIAAGTLVRGKFTAVNSAANITATLYLVG
jgi:hypothetical protein